VADGYKEQIMAKVEEAKAKFLVKMDALAEVDQIKMIAEKAQQPPKTVAMGLTGVGIFVALMFALFAVGMKMLLELSVYIPAVIKSIKAIESKEKDDDTELLSFWVVYCFFTICDPLIGMVFFWVPYFGLVKFLFLQYCYRFKGTLLITKTVLKPLYAKITSAMKAAPAEVPEKAD